MFSSFRWSAMHLVTPTKESARGIIAWRGCSDVAECEGHAAWISSVFGPGRSQVICRSALVQAQALGIKPHDLLP